MRFTPEPLKEENLEDSVQLASKKFRLQILFHCSVIFTYLITFNQITDVSAFTLNNASKIPSTIIVNGKKIYLQSLKNSITESNETLAEGSKVYIKNCALCHGDLLDGKGLYGEVFYPRPANFLDPKSILSKPKSYAYWRIMKGGFGLPKILNVFPIS